MWERFIVFNASLHFSLKQILAIHFANIFFKFCETGKRILQELYRNTKDSLEKRKNKNRFLFPYLLRRKRIVVMIKILFVCHGNICRSPMAEFVMKDMVKKAGLEEKFVIESKAARRDELGNDTHYGTKAKLRQMGIPFAKRRATLLSKSDYAAYDYLIAMDEENERDMLRLFGGDPEEKIRLLLEYADEDREVADPWYTGNFDETYDDVVEGCSGLLRFLQIRSAGK